MIMDNNGWNSSCDTDTGRIAEKAPRDQPDHSLRFPAGTRRHGGGRWQCHEARTAACLHPATHTHTHSLYSLSQRARPQPRTRPCARRCRERQGPRPWLPTKCGGPRSARRLCPQLTCQHIEPPAAGASGPMPHAPSPRPPRQARQSRDAARAPLAQYPGVGKRRHVRFRPPAAGTDSLSPQDAFALSACLSMSSGRLTPTPIEAGGAGVGRGWIEHSTAAAPPLPGCRGGLDRHQCPLLTAGSSVPAPLLSSASERAAPAGARDKGRRRWRAAAQPPPVPQSPPMPLAKLRLAISTSRGVFI